ncbi:Hypothetical predicted protein [Octopus vulgaris]|uniref:Uncharacterized protein n=1 Tax=Octopus vulgaris TaxID=6645 RepID=A0AA36BEI6_OCTVU|nr:Hypothetical predicted protein [Octopus vulgaris]
MYRTLVRDICSERSIVVSSAGGCGILGEVVKMSLVETKEAFIIIQLKLPNSISNQGVFDFSVIGLAVGERKRVLKNKEKSKRRKKNKKV